MSEIEVLKNLAPLPPCERGYGRQIYTCGKKGDRMIYGNGKSVVIRDMTDATSATCFAGDHKGKVKVAAFAPSGNWVASGDDQGVMMVWGDANFSVKATHEVITAIEDIAWDADGRRILAGGTGRPGMAKCISWDSGNKLGDFNFQTKNILSVDIKQTRPFRAVCASEDNSVAFYEGPPFKFTKDDKTHTRYPNKVKFSPAGDHFISVGSDSAIVLSDAKTGEKLKELKCEDGHAGAIYSFAWSPDSKFILTCGADKTAKIWNVEEGNVTTTFTFGDEPTLQDMQCCAIWHKDMPITCSLSGALNYLDMGNPKKPLKVVMGHKERVSGLAVDSGSKKFYTCDINGVLCSWTDYVASWFTGDDHGGKMIKNIALNSDCSKLLSIGLDNFARWSDTATLVSSVGAIKLESTPACCACSSKVADLAVVCTAKNIHVINGAEIVSSTEIAFAPSTVGFTPDGSQIFVGSDKNHVHVYALDGNSLKEVRVDDEPHLKPPKCAATSNAETNLYATAGGDKYIVIRDAATGDHKNWNKWEYHSAAINSVAFNPSGTKFASVANDLSIIIWSDLKEFNVERKESKMAHRVSIDNCAFLDDETLVTSGGDGFIKIWKC